MKGYFSSEDAPLLSDFCKDFLYKDLIDVRKDLHGPFEVASFPATPILPPSPPSSVEEDDFSDFVESPTEEVPPSLTRRPAHLIRTSQPPQRTPELMHDTRSVSSAFKKFSELSGIEYFLHVTILLGMQLLIPIPFMIPMSINFTKRAVKLFFLGTLIGLAGHAAFNVAYAIPSARSYSPASFAHIYRHLSSFDSVLPALWTQVKWVAVGGVVIGAAMAHILNIFILGHTICRLSRGLEPDPSTMRRAMDSSKAFRFIQRLTLDITTGVFAIPVGLAVRSWWCGLWGFAATQLPISSWHAAMVGGAGVLAVQILLWVQRPQATVKIAKKLAPVHKRIQKLQMAERKHIADI